MSRKPVKSNDTSRAQSVAPGVVHNQEQAPHDAGRSIPVPVKTDAVAESDARPIPARQPGLTEFLPDAAHRARLHSPHGTEALLNAIHVLAEQMKVLLPQVRGKVDQKTYEPLEKVLRLL